jgi:hypothetical protein
MAKSKPPKPPAQYDVGYGRPPVHSRSSPASPATSLAVEKVSRPPTKRLLRRVPGW